ncbi:type II toxin-antitoxin system Phd/YefM family antitoxin [Mangrovibrevibacter kandeliae]|uniref:type II toxin-antitoxin system Phd/YefM family antitoxin n=1 Tax=Mangrovibrevibacter kandeliae TaxID=2968473 RepID=UPI002119480A|nr:type II toxin-antitoxin system Phd/YefM family antitoxin [Aurantimonas sp. CSK15Z-1]MCQ8782865.1 type II toxin-antitoxin system Phd/YefM family antitoxin [Aurantimonas sp. CSK15Z-1]
MGNQWTLQDATNEFPAVVEAAQGGAPQHVTRQGVEAVVVLSAEEYRRLMALDAGREPKRDFVEFLFSAPKLPDGLEDLFEPEERPKIVMRGSPFREGD